MEEGSVHNTHNSGNMETGGNVVSTENKKYIDPECYNDDLEEVIINNLLLRVKLWKS